MRTKKRRDDQTSAPLMQLMQAFTADVVPLDDGRKNRAGLNLPVTEHRKKVLRAARDAVKLGQREFSKKIGRSVTYVNRHEQFKEHMTIDGVVEWAKGCDMDAVALFAKLVQPVLKVEEPSCPT